MHTSYIPWYFCSMFPCTHISKNLYAYDLVTYLPSFMLCIRIVSSICGERAQRPLACGKREQCGVGHCEPRLHTLLAWRYSDRHVVSRRFEGMLNISCW